jgi:hypothetical protein
MCRPSSSPRRCNASFRRASSLTGIVERANVRHADLYDGSIAKHGQDAEAKVRLVELRSLRRHRAGVTALARKIDLLPQPLLGKRRERHGPHVFARSTAGRAASRVE